MALTKCRECGKEISTTAKACPNCGAAPAKKTGVLTWIIGGFFAITVGSCVIGQQERDQRAASQPARPAPTAAELQQKAKDDADINRAVAAARVIKAASKDPGSFQLESFYYLPGGAVCLEYRAKNSFGAIVPGKGVFDGASAILTNSDGNKFVKVWNDVCTKGNGQERAGGIKQLGLL